MASQALQAISPIDGRYASKTASLIPFFSEQALIKVIEEYSIEATYKVLKSSVEDALAL